MKGWYGDATKIDGNNQGEIMAIMTQRRCLSVDSGDLWTVCRKRTENPGRGEIKNQDASLLPRSSGLQTEVKIQRMDEMNRKMKEAGEEEIDS